MGLDCGLRCVGITLWACLWFGLIVGFVCCFMVAVLRCFWWFAGFAVTGLFCCCWVVVNSVVITLALPWS